MKDLKEDENRSADRKDKQGILFGFLLILFIATGLRFTYWIMTDWAGYGNWVGYFWATIFLVTELFVWAHTKTLRKGLILSLQIFVTCAVCATIMWCADPTPYRAGINAYDDGAYRSAIANFDIVIEKKTDRSDVYLKRCGALSRIGRPADALLDCNQAIKMGHLDKEESHGIRGRVFVDLGRHEEAIKDFDVAIRENPNVYDLHGRGREYNILKRYELALKDYRRITQMDDQYKIAYWGIGNALYGQGKRKEALEAYEVYAKSIEKLPKGLKARMDALRKEL